MSTWIRSMLTPRKIPPVIASTNIERRLISPPAVLKGEKIDVPCGSKIAARSRSGRMRNEHSDDGYRSPLFQHNCIGCSEVEENFKDPARGRTHPTEAII